jgi:hypothetical protein
VHVEVPDLAHDASLRRGRGTSSPPQFGQTLSIASAHAGQNVHSNEQMRASSSAARVASQLSHAVLISRAITASARLRG